MGVNNSEKCKVNVVARTKNKTIASTCRKKDVPGEDKDQNPHLITFLNQYRVFSYVFACMLLHTMVVGIGAIAPVLPGVNSCTKVLVFNSWSTYRKECKAQLCIHGPRVL